MADGARGVSNSAMLETSFLDGANALFIEQMHARYLEDPNAVDPSWRTFFAELGDNTAAHGPSWAKPGIANPAPSELTAL